MRYVSESAAVIRDRSGCIWLRNRTGASYQCPGDAQAVNLTAQEIGIGYPQIYELRDGAILIPGFSRLAIGRPHNIRTLPIATCGVFLPLSDGGVLSNDANGLLYLPRHLSTEFWTESDGLGGNVWSVFAQGSQIYAATDQSTHVLHGDRRNWRVLAGPAGRMAEGPAGTILVANGRAVFQMTPDWRVLRKSPNVGIRAAVLARNGATWAGGDGLYHVAVHGQSLDLIPTGSSADLQYVSDIKTASDDTLWVCTQTGLIKIGATNRDLPSAVDDPSNSGCRARQ